MARKGLGKGLDSLIPDFYNEDFDSNSPQSLEDILNEQVTEEEADSPKESKEKENIFEQVLEEQNDQEGGETSGVEESEQEDGDKYSDGDSSSEDNSGDASGEEDVQTSPEIQIQEEHVAEVKEIVEKNPRITLWSSRSSAVFRYLRKTEPEFSISKEASILIEEAVSKKYPEIWALFDDD